MKLGGIELRGGKWLSGVIQVVVMVIALLLVSVYIQAAVMPKGHLVDEDWHQGVCPTCGVSLDLAYIAEDGALYLVCAHCSTEWRYPRLKCPFCSNENQETLGYFFVEGEDGHSYRIHVCEECCKYIKVILIPASPELRV